MKLSQRKTGIAEKFVIRASGDKNPDIMQPEMAALSFPSVLRVCASRIPLSMMRLKPCARKKPDAKRRCPEKTGWCPSFIECMNFSGYGMSFYPYCPGIIPKSAVQQTTGKTSHQPSYLPCRPGSGAPAVAVSECSPARIYRRNSRRAERILKTPFIWRAAAH